MLFDEKESKKLELRQAARTIPGRFSLSFLCMTRLLLALAFSAFFFFSIFFTKNESLE
jgi:hypothetical protein